MRQLTCKMVWYFSFILFVCLFLSKIGGKILKNSEKCESVWKSAKKCEKAPRRFCPLVVAFSFSLMLRNAELVGVIMTLTLSWYISDIPHTLLHLEIRTRACNTKMPTSLGARAIRNAIRANQELLVPLFLMGCFPVYFEEVNGPLGRNQGNAPLRLENGPLKRGNGPLRPWCWLAFQSAA